MEKPNRALSIREYVGLKILGATFEARIRREEQAKLVAENLAMVEHDAFLDKAQDDFWERALQEHTDYVNGVRQNQKEMGRRSLRGWQEVSDQGHNVQLQEQGQERDLRQIREIYMQKRDESGYSLGGNEFRSISELQL